MTFKVRRLEPTDDRAPFRSDNVELDRFFLRYAGQNQFRHHIGTSYERLGFVRLDTVSGELGDRSPTLAMFLELGQEPVLKLGPSSPKRREQAKARRRGVLKYGEEPQRRHATRI